MISSSRILVEYFQLLPAKKPDSFLSLLLSFVVVLVVAVAFNAVVVEVVVVVGFRLMVILLLLPPEVEVLRTLTFCGDYYY